MGGNDHEAAGPRIPQEADGNSIADQQGVRGAIPAVERRERGTGGAQWRSYCRRGLVQGKGGGHPEEDGCREQLPGNCGAPRVPEDLLVVFMNLQSGRWSGRAGTCTTAKWNGISAPLKRGSLCHSCQSARARRCLPRPCTVRWAFSDQLEKDYVGLPTRSVIIA